MIRAAMVFAGLLLAAPSAGQVEGRVTDARGRPLPAVRVDLWRGAARVASRASDADGAFRFAEAAGAVRLSVRTLGYAPLEREVGAPAAGVELRLAPAAVALEGVTAQAAPRVRCPQRDDPEARALWTTLRGRYAHDQDTLTQSFFALQHESLVRRAGLGFPGEARIGRGWHGAPGRNRRADFHRTSRFTYGYPLQGSLEADFARWRYRALHTTDAMHFVSPEFGARHTLRVLARGRTGTVLGFCPVPGAVEGASLRGTLAVAPDTSLARAEWEFRTPRPPEEAGGEATFVPRGGRPIPLLPHRTLYWRRLAGHRDRYFQRGLEFVTHLLLPPDADAGPGDWVGFP